MISKSIHTVKVTSKKHYFLNFIAALLLVSFFKPSLGFACRPGVFNDSNKKKASVVFIGEPVSYKKLKNKNKKKSFDEAEVTFRTVKMLKGKKKKFLKFKMSQNTDTGVPKNLKQFIKCYGKKSEVGLIKAGKAGELYSVVQGPCHPPYILPIGKPKPSICIFTK